MTAASVLAVIGGGVLGTATCAWARGVRRMPRRPAATRSGPRPRPTHLAVAAATLAGLGAARALGDPLLAPLAAALAWGAVDLARRVGSERAILRRTRDTLPFLQRVLQEVEAGTHPLRALSWAAQADPPPPWLLARMEALGRTLAAGEPVRRAAERWTREEEVPVLRLFAHLLATHAVWGTSLADGLRRILREADQSVAFGTEERSEHGLYEALTAAFLALDVAVGVAALAGWPHGVAGPARTLWGHALLIGSGLLTALAVAVPVSLASGAPPRLRTLGNRAAEDRDA